MADAAADFRRHFPIFDTKVHLNSCSQGALSHEVRAAYETFLDGWDRNGANWDVWVERNEAARQSFAALINAPARAVGVTTSVSAGISSFISSLDLRGDRRRIVITDYEFPTTGQIAHAQARRGAEVITVPSRNGTVEPDDIAAVVDERTALVLMTHVCFRNGSRLDPGTVAGIAHSSGALVAVDSYQAVGSLPIDVAALDVDVLACGALKYLLGSAGLGFLYVRPGLVESHVPTVTGWFADEDIFAMNPHRYAPADDARRYESGTPPVPSLFAGVAGMELLRSAGVDTVEAHVQTLVERLRDGLDELGATVVTPAARDRRGAMVAVASTDDHALVSALETDGIGVSCRDGNLRISLHLYNNTADIDACLAAIATHRTLLR